MTHAWSAPYRQKRINDLLSAKSKLTIDDFRATLGDVYAIGGSIFAREIVKLFNGDASSDGNLKSTLRLFGDWDGRVVADSRAALFINELAILSGVWSPSPETSN